MMNGSISGGALNMSKRAGSCKALLYITLGSKGCDNLALTLPHSFSGFAETNDRGVASSGVSDSRMTFRPLSHMQCHSGGQIIVK